MDDYDKQLAPVVGELGVIHRDQQIFEGLPTTWLEMFGVTKGRDSASIACCVHCAPTIIVVAFDPFFVTFYCQYLFLRPWDLLLGIRGGIV